VIYSSRIAFYVGIVSIILSLLPGIPLGIVAGFYGGRIDKAIMTVMDIILAFPSILLAIVIVSILGQGLTNALLAVGVVLLPQIARVVRSSVISIRERDYVEAERAIGASDAQIVFAAILPNSLAPLIVQSTLALATAILDVAALSFLGLGAQPPQPEWGAMLTDAFRSGFGVFPEGQHGIIFPGMAIALSVLAQNFIGDGLRDALDPRRQR